jgi:hypothetical protein
MKRSQLDNLLRAASRIAGDTEVLLVRSQAILGTYDDSLLPDPAIGSLELDVTFFGDYDRLKTQQVEAHLGEESMFHHSFGYNAEGVTLGNHDDVVI